MTPVSFADVAERLNPSVVNIDASSGGGRLFRPLPIPERPDLFDRPFSRDRDESRRGAGTGFIIDPAGYILTNHHVIEGAERIMVRLVGGRSLPARLVGSDPDTDIALIKVTPDAPLVAAPLGDSGGLRVGEWVCAIGNPLAYEHTVTVGVVSFIGRKLYDASPDRYIQTDAAINLGNSGGPLINSRGQVIGINAAISSRANNIGFAVPINQARAILPQLRTQGRVARGYLGVGLKDIDEALARSLGVEPGRGAMVQDVTPGGPAWRAGLRAYDVVVALDGLVITGNEAFEAAVSARVPGTVATLQVTRDGRPVSLVTKLAERPARVRSLAAPGSVGRGDARTPALGLLVRDVDDDFVLRYRLPDDVRGVIVSAVDALSPAGEAGFERNLVLLEWNRQPLRNAEHFRHLAGQLRPGDAITLFVYNPELRQHQLRALRLGER